MINDPLKKAEELFLELVDLPRERWAGLLDDRCGPDDLLKQSVKELLGFHDQADGFLDKPEFLTKGLVGLRRDEPEETLKPGTRVGPFAIQGLLGTGGMGSVYVAEQERPRRTVALKVIRRGLSTHTLIRRFEHEAEMLGRLHHPGIAQIYQAGAAPVELGGMPQPFIAMEIVNGPPLHKYAETRRLNTKEKLELVARVCDAMHHAHQRGVIHRDLKPQNILVAEDGQPKILDFGVARAADADLRVTTLQTSIGQLIGTLPYMSPEQVLADPGEVDTRSDVYAMGVVLYQLLTGKLPLDVSSRPIPEAARVIRDEAPTRLGSVNRIFRGEIETIVSKAMEKDKTRRYQSAAELAADLRHYLAGEPIAAKTDSAIYVLVKQIRRYKGVVATAAAFVIGIIAFAVFAIVQANRNEELATNEAAAHNRAKGALAEAQSERARADAQAERLRRNLYLSNIGFAQAAHAAHDVERERRILESCPEDLRGWEWRYLQRIADDSAFAVTAPAANPILHSVGPDARRAIIGRPDGSALVLDALTGEEILVVEPKSGLPLGSVSPQWGPLLCGEMVFAPDGRTVLLGWTSGELQTLDLVTSISEVLIAGTTDVSLPATTRPALREYSPTGSLILASKPGNLSLLLLEAASLEPVREIRVSGAVCTAFSPDASLIAIGLGDGSVRLVDTESGEVRRVLSGHTNQVRGVAFSGDGLRIASASADATARIWDIDTGGQLHVLRGSENKLNTVVWLADDTRVAAGGTDRVIFVFDALSGDLLRSHAGHSSTVRTIQRAADPAWLVSVGYDRSIRWWTNVGKSRELRSKSPRSFWSGVITPDGTTYIAADAGGTLRLYDTATLRQFKTIQTNKATVSGMSLSADGTLLAVSGWDSGVSLVELPSGRVVRTFDKHPTKLAVGVNRAIEVALTPSKSSLVVAFDDGVLRIYDAATGDLSRQFTFPPAAISSLAVSPDESTIALCSQSDSLIRIIDAVDGTQRRLLRGPSSYSWELKFSANGKQLISAGDDGVVLLWDLATESPPARFLGHQGPVHCVGWSPDESRLVSCGWDNTVRVWHVESREELLNLRGNIGAVMHASFTPDGQRILAASNYGEVTVWDASPPSRAAMPNLDK